MSVKRNLCNGKHNTFKIFRKLSNSEQTEQTPVFYSFFPGIYSRNMCVLCVSGVLCKSTC